MCEIEPMSKDTEVSKQTAYAGFRRVVKLLGNLLKYFEDQMWERVIFSKGCQRNRGITIKKLVGSVREVGAASQVSLLKFDIDLNLLPCS